MKNLPIHLYVFNSLQHDIRSQCERDKDVYRNLLSDLYEYNSKIEYNFSIFEYDPKNNLDNYKDFLRDFNSIIEDRTERISVFVFNGHGGASKTVAHGIQYFFSINTNTWKSNEYKLKIEFDELYEKINQVNEYGPIISIFNTCTTSAIRDIIFQRLKPHESQEIDDVEKCCVDISALCLESGTDIEFFTERLKNKHKGHFTESAIEGFFNDQLKIVPNPTEIFKSWSGKIDSAVAKHNNFSYLVTLGVSAGINNESHSDVVKAMVSLFSDFDLKNKSIKEVFRIFKISLQRIGNNASIPTKYNPELFDMNPPEPKDRRAVLNLSIPTIDEKSLLLKRYTKSMEILAWVEERE